MSVLHPSPGQSRPAVTSPGGSSLRRSVLAALAVLAGSALAGLVGGLIWRSLVTRPEIDLYQKVVYPTTNEPTAFFSNDAWYCLVALIGGLLIGLVGYLLAVRRHGPLPMAAIVAGAVGAGYLALFVGQDPTVTQFEHLVAHSPVNSVIAARAPIALAAQSAIAFWPIAACLAAGALALRALLRDRRIAEQRAAAIRAEQQAAWFAASTPVTDRGHEPDGG